ncbi:uncharacterized protein LOC144576394 isoform X4 [Callithrix jacchus]
MTFLVFCGCLSLLCFWEFPQLAFSSEKLSSVSMLEPWRGRWLRGSLPTSSTGGESRECQRDTSEEPAQKRLCTENTFWRDSGPHSVPMRNSSCDPTENVEKTKVNMAAAQHHH